MIFIFHDNGDGDDDNAVCIVMLMPVPGVTGRLCKETVHWLSTMLSLNLLLPFSV